MIRIHTMALAALFATAAVPAMAQNNSENEGLVNVSLGEVVIQDIANDLNVNVSQIPVTVQVPVGVAANVCNISASVLAADKKKAGDATCTAQNNSQALTQVVQRQLNAQ